ncbi:MAG: hypothetical protein ACREEB_16575 [Caulobacteraceae bacterium]
MAIGWDDFYFMIGSASAGLIGLMFVVVTLTAGIDPDKARRGSALYLTPTVVHFAAVFTSAAISLTPGLSVRVGGVALGLVALVGLACALRAAIGIVLPRPPLATPHWSDFWLYGFAPCALYAALVVTSIGIWADAGWTARALAALLLALMLLAIRNAWDTVTSLAPMRPGG